MLETRKALEVRLRKVDQAHRLPARIELERSRIQIVDLAWWEHRESPASYSHASDVVWRVVVARSDRAVTDPDRGRRVNAECGEVQVVVLAHARQVRIDQCRADVHRRWLSVFEVSLDLIQ